MPHKTPYQLILAAFTQALFFCTLPASGQTVMEDLKIVAPDAAAEDQFGGSVSLFGNTAIIGAPLDEGIVFNNAGSAYLIDITSGQQLFKLTASDQGRDSFGISVGISHTTAIVGSPFDSAPGPFSGSAYIFDTTTGQQIFKLSPKDSERNSLFGYSVAISGNIAIVGKPVDDHAGPNSGSAYLFDTTTGQQLFKLIANDADWFDNFGQTVAISGTTAIVGADATDDSGPDSGSVYLFDTTTGQQIFKLTANDAAQEDYFGRFVSIDGTLALIGAIGDDDSGTNSGSAYIFDTVTGQQLFKLTANDGAENDWFGVSGSISGTTAIIGAQKDDIEEFDTGSAYLFDTTTGKQISKLVASDAAADDSFGYAVTISESTALVGASRNDSAGTNSGSAYLYRIGTDCSADLTGDGVLDFFDISAFLSAFANQDPIADFTGDGNFHFFDISAFLQAFNAGCP